MHLTPSNSLEENLLACKTDFAQWPAFLTALLSSQSVVLLDGEVGEDGVLPPEGFARFKAEHLFAPPV
jgi:hypothetical protein